jgi:16S rRNA (adenine1518-N6/adenine1519-N6)-dimethyltransferase
MSLPILPHSFVRATIMTQREVYERITASYGSKNYGLLSLILQRYFKVVKVLDVSRENFYPKPEVDSTIIGLKRNEVTADVSEYERELKIIEKIFSMRRKTLRQVLLKKFNLEDSQLSDIMKAVSGENLRAEQLPPDVIWMLVGVLKKLCV